MERWSPLDGSPWLMPGLRRPVFAALISLGAVVGVAFGLTLWAARYAHEPGGLSLESERTEWLLFAAIHLFLFLAGSAAILYAGMRAAQRLRDRERAAEAARVRERFSAAILDTVPGIVYLHDLPSGRYLYVSKPGLRQLGYVPPVNPDDAGRLLEELIQPEDREEFGRLHARWKAGSADTSQECTLRVRTSSGALRQFLFQETIFMADPAHGVRQVIGVTQDLTRRIEAEAALRDSESRYRELFENAYELIFTVDIEQRVTSVNRLLEEVTGYRREEIIGKYVGDFLTPESLHVAREMLRRKVSGGELRTRYEMEILAANGERIPVEVQSRLIHRDGEPIGVQGTARDLRARKHFEEQLRLLGAGLEAAANAVAIADADGRLIWANPAFTELTGYSLGEIDASAPLLADPEEHGPAFCEDLWTAVRSGKVWRGELLQRRKGGGAYTEEMTVTPVCNESGVTTHFIAIKQDITERRQAQQLLLDSESRLRHTLQHMPVMFCAFDGQGRVLHWNRECERLTGYPASEITRHADGLALLYPDPVYRARLLAEVEGRGRDFKDWEWRVTCKDGGTLIVAWSSASGRFPIPGWETWAIGVDVTKRKEAEAQLIERRRFIEAITDHLPLGFAVNDTRTGRIQYMNRSFEQIYGWSREEMPTVDDYFERVFPDPDMRKEARRRFSEDIDSGDPLRMRWDRVRTVTRDGTVRYVTAQNLHLPLDHLMISTVWDITDTVRVEKERRSLEAHVRQVQRIESLGVLAGGIAHDFNNILAAIVGYTEMARNHLGEPEKTERVSNHLEEVLRASARARELVAQILTFSRQGQHERRPIAVRSIVREALNLLRSSFPATIALETRLDEDCGRVIADPSQIHQVVMNLCTNAYQAMGPEGGRISVSLERVDEIDEAPVRIEPEPVTGPMLRLRVGDNGKGIPESDLERVFDPFFTTKDVGEGTGMGLAMVHGIVTAGGGAITLSSVVGEGSEFTVYLPLAAEAPESSAVIDGEMPGGSERILYVDDEAALARMGKLMLGRLGYEVHEFTSSAEALAAFEADPEGIDLVVTDLTMPELTGLDLARRMLGMRPDLPIMLVTGYTELLTPEQAREEGFSAFLFKPLSIKELAGAVRDALDRVRT